MRTGLLAASSSRPCVYRLHTSTFSRGSIVAHSSRDHETSGHEHLPLNQGLPLSLFHPYERLPPDGSTLMRDEEFCDPDERICKTPTHVYEAACVMCSGTGWARNSSNGRRGHLGTCISCHGLGYVRRTTARFIPEADSSLTLARDVPPPKHRPLFEPRRKQQVQRGPPRQQAPPPPPQAPQQKVAMQQQQQQQGQPGPPQKAAQAQQAPQQQASPKQPRLQAQAS